jgi:hypothetical protein
MSRPVQRLRTAGTPTSRASQQAFAQLAHHLTPRDREIITLVWEHRVLTTHQLAAICFPTPDKARHRLLHLHRHSVLERFQPWTPVGSAPWHWVLGPGGAYVLAGQRGIEVKELHYRRDDALAISHSIKLGHQIGVNEFFAQLHAYARRHGPNAAVVQWWHERRCADLWGDLARPDAYGRWRERQANGHLAEVDFFLEHDTGSETHARVADKLAGYAALSESTGISTPILLWLPSTARETNLRKVVGVPEVPVATAVHTPAATASEGPAGRVWLPAGSTGPRLRLAELADAWPEITQPQVPRSAEEK